MPFAGGQGAESAAEGERNVIGKTRMKTAVRGVSIAASWMRLGGKKSTERLREIEWMNGED